jgi:hypothetical protein
MGSRKILVLVVCPPIERGVVWEYCKTIDVGARRGGQESDKMG